MNTHTRIITGEPENVTEPQAREVAAAVRSYMSRVGLSQSKLARRVGMGDSSLSMFLHNLAGDWQATATDLDNFLAGEFEKARAFDGPKFIKTRVAKQIISGAELVCTRGGIGLIHGGSGIGKTTAIEHVLNTTPRAVYVSASTASARIKGILTDIGLATGRFYPDRAAYDVQARVCEALRGRDLLVIDEAHKYMGRGEICYDVLRDVLVKTGVPQLWVGTMDLVKHFNRRIDQGHEPLSQILSRVSIAIDLNDLKGDDVCIFSVDEIRQYVAAWPVKPDAQAVRYLVKLANLTNQGGLRLVSNLYATASLLGTPVVSMREIESAWQFLASKNARDEVGRKITQEDHEGGVAVKEARRATA